MSDASQKLRKLFRYQLRDYVEYQSGFGTNAPAVIFADADYEVGDGKCGLHEDAKSANEPAICYARADALIWATDEIERLTDADTAAAQVAAAYERGAELFDEKHHVFMVAKGRNPSDYMSEFSNAADKLRALATDTQADALELVRKEAEQTGYERGARLARNMALIEAAEIADQWATDAQRKHGNGGPKAQILSLMTIDEQTEAAQDLAFRKAVSS